VTGNHAAQSGRHPLKERGQDLYETPACAVEALLRVEKLPHWIWEPAAGRGAIARVLRVSLLLRLAFLESMKRTAILERSGLRAVHVFRRRLPMMHRAGWTGPRASSAMAFAWFVWDRNHRGPTTIDRISWGGA
jgi:hypothetical protein